METSDDLCKQLLSSLEVPRPGEMDDKDAARDMNLRFKCDSLIDEITLAVLNKGKLSSLSVPVEGWEFWFGIKNADLICKILSMERL